MQCKFKIIKLHKTTAQWRVYLTTYILSILQVVTLHQTASFWHLVCRNTVEQVKLQHVKLWNCHGRTFDQTKNEANCGSVTRQHFQACNRSTWVFRLPHPWARQGNLRRSRSQRPEANPTAFQSHQQTIGATVMVICCKTPIDPWEYLLANLGNHSLLCFFLTIRSRQLPNICCAMRIVDGQAPVPVINSKNRIPIDLCTMHSTQSFARGHQTSRLDRQQRKSG